MWLFLIQIDSVSVKNFSESCTFLKKAENSHKCTLHYLSLELRFLYAAQEEVVSALYVMVNLWRNIMLNFNSSPQKSLLTSQVLLSICCMLLSFFTFAQEESEEDALARMQAQLNGEVMSRPFLAERPKEVDNYIESMLKKNVKPPEYQGTYWRRGYTCRDLLRYNWTQYRNCRYYHRYHGRYYY